jgi:glycosyltransferase involved in cell wall biosynthesis
VRVVHCGKFYPPQYRGGLESVVAGLNAELVRRGVSVTAVVAAWKSGYEVDLVDGVRVVRAASLGMVFSQPIAPSLPALLRAEPGDLVHLHHPNPLGDIAVSGDVGRPLVITHHSEIVRQRFLWPVVGPLVRSALKRARRIAIGSEQLLRTSRELRGFESKARVIPFGIDNSRFAGTPAVLEKARSLRAAWGGRPVVLAVGRMVGYKGFHVLLQAAARLEATVVLVGGGPEEPRLRGLAPENVVFAGHVDDPELPAYYHACDVFCLPSLTIAEAFGMVLLEAMACGKPLVTTALPTGVSAVNRDGQTGLIVPPGNAGALWEALQSLIGDAPRREAMGRAAREVQGREYNAGLMGERYLALYREALA